MTVSVMVTDRVLHRFNLLVEGATLYHRCERCREPRLLLIRIAWDEQVCASCWRALGSYALQWPARTYADVQREALTALPEWPIVEEP